MLYTEERPQTRHTAHQTFASDPPAPNSPAPDGPSFGGDGSAVDTAPGHPLPTTQLQTPTYRRPWKKAGKRIREAYTTTLQIGFVLSLVVVLGLTQLEFQAAETLDIPLETQEVVAVEEVQQTQQETAPPPPLRPVAPVEVPNNTIVETQEIDFDASLDLNDALDTSAPPPEAPPPPAPETPEADEIFVVVEEQPVLIGGLKALQENIRYPVVARNAGIEGRVIVQFIVDEQGNVTTPTVMRGRHSSLNKEALRVIREATFTPGKQRGNAVKVQMALPITFRLATR